MKEPTHPNLGREVRVEQNGEEVHLIFVCETTTKADVLVADLVTQLMAGALHLTLTGAATGIAVVFDSSDE